MNEKLKTGLIVAAVIVGIILVLFLLIWALPRFNRWREQRQLEAEAKASGKTVEQLKLEKEQARQLNQCNEDLADGRPVYYDVEGNCSCLRQTDSHLPEQQRMWGQIHKCNAANKVWEAVEWNADYNTINGIHSGMTYDEHNLGEPIVYSTPTDADRMDAVDETIRLCLSTADCKGFTWLDDYAQNKQMTAQLKSHIPPVEEMYEMPTKSRFGFPQGVYTYDIVTSERKKYPLYL